MESASLGQSLPWATTQGLYSFDTNRQGEEFCSELGPLRYAVVELKQTNEVRQASTQIQPRLNLVLNLPAPEPRI